MSIDLNRGVTFRVENATGVKVYMYKDTPGVFLNAHGHEVADTLARGAGFDVKELKHARAKREALARATAAIETEYDAQTKKGGDKVKLLEKSGEYAAYQGPFGRSWVEGPDGVKLNDRPLTKEEALHLLKVIVETPDQDDPSPKETSDGST